MKNLRDLKAERRGNTLKGFRDFRPKARAGIWPAALVGGAAIIGSVLKCIETFDLS